MLPNGRRVALIAILLLLGGAVVMLLPESTSGPVHPEAPAEVPAVVGGTGDPLAQEDAPALLRADAAESDPLLAGTRFAGAGFVLRVTDEDGTPLAGARVLCGDPEWGYYGRLGDREWENSPLPIHAVATTDAEGVARVGGLPPVEPLMLAADAPGRTRAQRLLTSPGDGEWLEVGPWPLESAPSVRLHFVGEDGAPAPGVEFFLDAEGEEDDLRDLWFHGVSDAAGLAVLEHVPTTIADAWDAWVWARGRWLSESHSLVLDARQREATVRLRRGGIVSGKVLAEDGAPIAGAIVGITPSWGIGEQSGEPACPWAVSHIDLDQFRDGVPTAADGSFACAGRDVENENLHCITVYFPPGELYSSPWTDRTDGIEVRLPIRRTLRGSLQGPFEPARARLRLRGPQQTGAFDLIGRVSFTGLWPDPAPGADGGFAFTLPPGNYDLRVDYPGGSETVAEDLDLSADVDLGIIRLGRGASLLVNCPAIARLPAPTVELQRFELVESRWSNEAEEEWRGLRVEASRERPDAWRFLGLPPGRYRVIADAWGCEPAVAEVALGADEQKELTLEPVASGAVLVEILDRDGARLSNRALSLAAVQSDPPTARETLVGDLLRNYPYDDLAAGADGAFRTGDLPAGEYRVLMSLAESEDPRHYGPTSEIGTLRVEAGRTTHFSHSLGMMAAVRILVRDGAQPVTGAEVSCWPVEDGVANFGWDAFEDAGLHGLTDGGGTHGFEGLGPGDYLAAARSRPGEAWTFADFTLTDGEPTVEIALAGGEARGRVLDESGAAAGAGVTLCAEERIRRGNSPDEQADALELHRLAWGSEVAEVSASSDGSFHFSRLAAGRYRVRATASGDAIGWSEWFRMEDGGVVDLGEIRVRPYFEWEWTIRGLAAWDDYSAHLLLRPAEGGEVWESCWFWSDADESVVRFELPHGRWSAELVDHDGMKLGVLTILELLPDLPPAPLTLPAPESVGAKRME